MTTEEMIEVMKAYTEGKHIEYRATKNGNWHEAVPRWDWNNFEYRVKPENKSPIYRPYKDVYEMLYDINKRRVAIQHPVCSGIWLKMKAHKVEHSIHSIDYDEERILLGAGWASLKGAFANYTYLDGTPFGVQE